MLRRRPPVIAALTLLLASLVAAPALASQDATSRSPRAAALSASAPARRGAADPASAEVAKPKAPQPDESGLWKSVVDGLRLFVYMIAS